MALGFDRIGRWFRQAALGQRIAVVVGVAYIRVVHWTTRWDVHGAEHRQALLASGGPILAAIWHGRLLVAPRLKPEGRRTLAVISNNRDGDLITAVVERFGVDTIRGSTYDKVKKRDKGGREVMIAALAEIQEHGSIVALTPDGPRGPRMRVQDGIGRLALETGAPVIPVTFSVRRGIVARSWDRFLVPFPFNRGVMIYGSPIWPETGQSPEEHAALSERIESEMNALTAEADRLCGRDPVLPAPRQD